MQRSGLLVYRSECGRITCASNNPFKWKELHLWFWWLWLPNKNKNIAQKVCRWSARHFILFFSSCNYNSKYAHFIIIILIRHVRAQHESDSMQSLHCKHCNFTTKIASHLKRHILIHSGEKPFSCPHCDYKSNNLVNAALNPPVFAIWIIDLLFHLQENLRKHVIGTGKHPGRFLYECQVCDGKSDKSFGTNNNKEYKMHMQNVHQQKWNTFMLATKIKSIRWSTTLFYTIFR